MDTKSLLCVRRASPVGLIMVLGFLLAVALPSAPSRAGAPNAPAGQGAAVGQEVKGADAAESPMTPPPEDPPDPAADPASDLEPQAPSGPEPGDTTDVEEFLVVGSTVAMESILLRTESDQLLNVLSAEELSKFAATDVAEGLKRMAGVYVVEGQFAVIRGLEERYSSTLFNSAPVPSPDPDRQSIQLDLFPTEVVTNLIVAKTFAPDLPGNSSGGSIDIVTSEYPEDFEMAMKAKAGFNTNAINRFLEFENESPIGKETDGASTIEQEYGGLIGGRTEFGGREVRYKALLNWELDYDSAEGFQEAREPRPCLNNVSQPCLPGQPPSPAGDPSHRQAGLSGGRFDLTTSERSAQSTGYLGLGFDLDQAGNHRIDTATFYTKKNDEVVQLKEHGILPNFDYSVFSGGDFIPGLLNGYATNSAFLRSARETAGEGAGRGGLWFSDFYESKSFDRTRDLLVTQVNGEHFIDQLPGLHVGWAGNYAHTTQEEKARGLRYFYEPNDSEQPATGPTTSDALGPGVFAANKAPFYNDVDVDENQGFGRMDADYTRAVSESVTLALTSGGWYEHATRSVDSSFLESPLWKGSGSSNIAQRGAEQRELGLLSFNRLILRSDGQPAGLRD